MRSPRNNILYIRRGHGLDLSHVLQRARVEALDETRSCGVLSDCTRVTRGDGH